MMTSKRWSIGIALCLLLSTGACTSKEPAQEENTTTPSSEGMRKISREVLKEATAKTESVLVEGTPQIDKESGLIVAEHWELVKGQCTVCHSAKQLTNQRGTRQTWTESIRWMQATQGLWQFAPEMEKQILDYLEKNYAPTTGYRRVPIPPSLMPENPYKAKVEIKQ